MIERILFILLVNFLFYFKTLRYKFCSDDLPAFQNSPNYKPKNELHRRYLQLLGWTRVSMQQDHLITMVVHALVCVFIYLAFGKSNVSFLASLLFSFNPANNQVSVWMAGRNYALSALLLLISITMPLVAPITLIACASLTAGYVAPLALIGSNYAYLLLIMPIAWFIHRKKFKSAVLVKLNTETVSEDHKFHFKKIILGIKTFGFYLALCLIPFRITFYHSFLQSCAGNDIMKKRAYSIKDKFFWIGLIALIIFIVNAIYQWNMQVWGFFWFIITIAPVCNIRRIQQEVAERYIYVPAIGLMFFLANMIIDFPITIAVFFGMYMTKMWFCMEQYRDDYYLVEFSTLEDPGAWYTWHIRGHKRWDNQSYKEALTMWVMALMISPKEFKLLFNIAIVLRLLKNEKESDAYLQKAIDNIVPGQEKEANEYVKMFRARRVPLLL